MSITWRVLGGAGADNALYVTIDTGQVVERLLFDCGEGVLTGLPFAEVKAIDQLLFSHLHMDHVAGFDAFFRANYPRNDRPNVITGPTGTARILQRRFQGFLWNLNEGMSASWRVRDVEPTAVRTVRFELSEAFATAYDEGQEDRAAIIAEGKGFTVEAVTMEHGTESLAYIVRERDRVNVETNRLGEMGLKPGPWVRQVKDPSATGVVTVNGQPRQLEELRALLLTKTAGGSVAYLTDFLLDERAMERLAPRLNGVGAVVCESQYREADAELAARNYHMTSVRAARLAARAGVGELMLMHVSDRYSRAEWVDMLREARALFPKTRFPEGWVESIS